MTKPSPHRKTKPGPRRKPKRSASKPTSSASKRATKIAVTLTGRALGGLGSFIALIHVLRHAARDAGWSEERVGTLYSTLLHAGGGREGVLKVATRWFAVS